MRRFSPFRVGERSKVSRTIRGVPEKSVAESNRGRVYVSRFYSSSTRGNTLEAVDVARVLTDGSDNIGALDVPQIFSRILIARRPRWAPSSREPVLVNKRLGYLNRDGVSRLGVSRGPLIPVPLSAHESKSGVSHAFPLRSRPRCSAARTSEARTFATTARNDDGNRLKFQREPGNQLVPR